MARGQKEKSLKVSGTLLQSRQQSPARMNAIRDRRSNLHGLLTAKVRRWAFYRIETRRAFVAASSLPRGFGSGRERPILRVITAIAAFTALAAALSLSDVTFACEGKVCAGDFDCDPHHICMQWPNGSATCEWPGANPVMRASRWSNADSCSNDLECPEGWRCEKQAQHDGVTGSAAQCVPPSHLRISY